MVCHGHVVRRQCVAPIGGVSGERLEDADACARGRTTTEFGGVEKLPFRTHTSAVEQAAFVEQVGALQEEGTVFSKAHLVWTEVEHEVVRNHLAKVWDQGHVHGECIADADLGVKAAVDGRSPLSVALVIHGGRRVGTDVGEQGDSWRGIYALDASKNTALVDHAVHGGVEGVPHGFFPRTAHGTPNVHAPFLLHPLRQGGHAELAPRHANLRGPAAGVDLALHLPNAIPRIVRPLGIHDEVVERPPWRGAETHRVDAVVVRTEPDAKLVRVFHLITHTQLLQDGIRRGVVHLCSDVQVLVVVGNPHLGAVGRGTLRKRAALGEMHGTWRGLPNVLEHQAIELGRRLDAKRGGHLVAQVEGRLGFHAPTASHQNRAPQGVLDVFAQR